MLQDIREGLLSNAEQGDGSPELNLACQSGYDSMHLSPALPQVSFNCRSAANKPISSNKVDAARR